MSNVTEFIAIEPTDDGAYPVVSFEGFVASGDGRTDVMVNMNGVGFQMEASAFFREHKLHIDYEKANDEFDSVMFMADHMVTAA